MLHLQGMSELHRFLFDGVPVRGQLVRLTESWRELLQRRAANTQTGAYPAPVVQLLGEMTAASVLMQAGIKFGGSLVMQIFGDGPVKLAVAEVQSDLRLRATASLAGPVHPGARLSELVNPGGTARCAITLDHGTHSHTGWQSYQGVVPLSDHAGAPFDALGRVIEHYMHQSEQLDTTLVLAADPDVAAGLLLQRIPVQGERNLSRTHVAHEGGLATIAGDEDDFERLSILARSLRPEELLSLDAHTILHRLFWNEHLRRFEGLTGMAGPRFACSCSRARVAGMLRSLGREEVESILHEQGRVEVGCEYCGQQECFDAVDVARLFTAPEQQSPLPGAVQ